MLARHLLGYARPTDLDEALSLMADRSWTVLAGGTDLYPATQAQTLAGDILDITALPDLQGITEHADHWRIGARVTWTDIRRADLPPAFHALQLAAAEVGGVQIQNTGTVVGNLCNASPAADGVPGLLILDARVELASTTGTRTVPLADFLTGPRQTIRNPDELVTAILVPKPATGGIGVPEAGRAGLLGDLDRHGRGSAGPAGRRRRPSRHCRWGLFRGGNTGARN